MHQRLNIGFPIVNLQVTFKKACRLEDTLSWSLEVRKLGNTSLTLGVGVSCQGEERLAAELVVVCVDLIESGVTARDIPADIRLRMADFLVEV
jgi:4-hydroxybenzoyl-CoA thioesterase